MSDASQNILLKWALAYAKMGWPVIALHTPHRETCSCSRGALCTNQGKHPRYHEKLLKNGPKSATTDPEIITQWWSLWPDANIGIATGKKSFDVLDVDVLGDGPDTLRDMETEHGDLPDTIEQITGSGGRQVMFAYCGGLIGNAVRFADGLDTRSEGGLVVVPPSLHKSGKRYEWEASSSPFDGKKLAPMPPWLLGKILENRKKYGSNGTGVDVAKILSGLKKGERDEELFRYACRLRTLGLHQVEAEAIIRDAAAKCDPPFDSKEASKKVAQAWKYQDPPITDAQFVPAPEKIRASEANEATEASSTNRSKVKQTTPFVKQSEANQNYYGILTTWLESCEGTFKMQEAAEELGWRKNPTNYSNFRTALSRAVQNGLISKVGPIRGIYRVIRKDYEEIDILNAAYEEFPLVLPLGLHKLVEFSPKEIILVAGETNAGKTSFIFNAMWQNIFHLEQLGRLRPKAEEQPEKIGIRYFSSEMGAPVIKRKLLDFGECYPLHKFAHNVTVIARNHGFQDCLDPSGLNCIDYLEAPGGDYYKMAPTITEIFAELTTGVALIAIQKRRGTDIGRGGEGTLEKPRLAIALSYDQERRYHTAKITKAKVPRGGRSIDGLEIDFVIERGVKIIEVSEWAYKEQHERRRKHANYRKEEYHAEF